MSDPEPL